MWKWNYGASPVNNFTSRKICSNRVCRSLPSSTTDAEVYSFHVPHPMWSQNCQSWSSVQDWSTPQLFQQLVVHLKIAPKISLQLGSWLVPRRFLRFCAGVAVQRVMGRTKNKKRRFPFRVESSLVPLRFWSFSWSLRRGYSRKRLGTSQVQERTSHSWR